jgi:hypothetical protein
LTEFVGRNSFGICLERGFGVHKNQRLAVQCYLRTAKQGHPNSANHFEFCFEHGRGVQQNIEMAAEYYKFASDQGHPENSIMSAVIACSADGNRPIAIPRPFYNHVHLIVSLMFFVAFSTIQIRRTAMRAGCSVLLSVQELQHHLLSFQHRWTSNGFKIRFGTVIHPS